LARIAKRVNLPITLGFLTATLSTVPAGRKVRRAGNLTRLRPTVFRARVNGQRVPMHLTVTTAPVEARTSSALIRAPRGRMVPASRTIGNGLMRDGWAGTGAAGGAGTGTGTKTVVGVVVVVVEVVGGGAGGVVGTGAGAGPTTISSETEWVAPSGSVTVSVTVWVPNANDAEGFSSVESTSASPSSNSQAQVTGSKSGSKENDRNCTVSPATGLVGLYAN
jgi:hypothetical protein